MGLPFRHFVQLAFHLGAKYLITAIEYRQRWYWPVAPVIACFAMIRRLMAKPDKIIVDLYAANPSSWKTPCMAVRMVS